MNLYAVTKQAIVDLARCYAEAKGMKMVVLHFFISPSDQIGDLLQVDLVGKISWLQRRG